LKKKHLWLILFYLGCAAIGFFGAYFDLFSGLLDHLTIENALIYLLLFLISLFLVINIHEFGHFVFGKLLGYKLLMYQIGLLNFTYENGKMKFSFKKTKGFDGFCAMIPPKDASAFDKRNLLYYAGGIGFNVATGILALVALSITENPSLRSFIYIFAWMSIILGLFNLIPFKTAGNQFSDGKFIIGILRQNEHVSAMLALQNVVTQLAGGIRPKKLNFDHKELANFDDPSLFLLQYFHALDQENDDKAKELIEKLISRLDDVSSIALPGNYYEIITAGILFNQSEWIEKYYSLVEKTLNHDRDLNGERVKAYYAWYTGNQDQAKQHIERAKAVADKFPLRGQAEMELALLDRLEQKINSDLTPAEQRL